jgi:phosphoserine phosphatase RsbU/P
MTMRSGFTNFSQQLADFASRFEAQVRERSRVSPRNRKGGVLGTIFLSLKELFTRDVTREGLREMFQQDLRDTFRFFTHEVDFDVLRPLPWHARYPKMFWQVFTALAYRMTPPRRIVFAVGALSFLIGLIQSLSVTVETQDSGTWIMHGQSVSGWWLISLVIFVLLLLLELRDKLDLKGDLIIAREIQFGLVPSKPFHQGGMHIHCHMRPANTVGGDYYDIIELEGSSRVAVVVGDVAGKGMPAALLMALLQGSLRTLITAGFRGSELVSKLNRYLCANIPSNSLITLFYGELNLSSGELAFINAGHNAPFLIQADGGVQRLDSTALVLGIVEDSRFETAVAQLDEGDRLVLFTDGVSEAFNEKDEEYSEERLGHFLSAHKDLSQEQLVEFLIADVLKFCSSVRPSDDMTLMSIERRNL